MITMRPRELFGVAIRVLAVWCWTQAAYYGFLSFLKSVGTAPANSYPVQEDISVAMFYVILGGFLMAGVRALVWLAYGDAPKGTFDTDGAREPSEPSS